MNESSVNNWAVAHCSHLKLRERLKLQHTRRIHGMGGGDIPQLAYYRESWMDREKSAHWQLVKACSSASLTITRMKYGSIFDLHDMDEKRFPLPKSNEPAPEMLPKISKFKIAPETAVKTPAQLGWSRKPTPNPRRKNQRDEWLGDALLRFFCREWLLEREGVLRIAELIVDEQEYQTNGCLSRFATSVGLATPHAVEVELYLKFKLFGLDSARTYARSIYLHHQKMIDSHKPKNHSPNIACVAASA